MLPHPFPEVMQGWYRQQLEGSPWEDQPEWDNLYPPGEKGVGPLGCSNGIQDQLRVFDVAKFAIIEERACCRLQHVGWESRQGGMYI